MKTIQVNIPPQNLQFQHKMHHKLGHQQTTNLLEFQLGLLVQDQIHMIHNHTQIHLHDATLLSTFPSDDELQDETQNLTSLRNISVNFSSPTRTISNTTQSITRSIYDPHHSLLPLKIQTKQFDLKTIITSKLPADIMTHSITPFIHTLIQRFKRIIFKILLNLTVILFC